MQIKLIHVNLFEQLAMRLSLSADELLKGATRSSGCSFCRFKLKEATLCVQYKRGGTERGRVKS
jgi:hypothetical protein